MTIPLEVNFRDVEKSPRLESLLRRKADKLERFNDRVTSCRVAVAQPKAGGVYRVRITVAVPPGSEIVVHKDSRKPGGEEVLKALLNDAFSAVQRQLKEVSARQRWEVKSRDEPRALVVRKFDDYGFLRTLDGREIYFHRNSAGDEFARLAVGTEVRFAETMGEKGPQATTVHIVSKPGKAPTEGESGVEPPPGWR